MEYDESTFARVWQVVTEIRGDAPYPALTAAGVTRLHGFDFEIKAVAKLPGGERCVGREAPRFPEMNGGNGVMPPPCPPRSVHEAG